MAVIRQNPVLALIVAQKYLRLIMCLAMYLFTNDALLGPSWIGSNPRMFVEEVLPKQKSRALNWHHTERHVYYIGSYQGCGCGWQTSFEGEDIAEKRLRAADRERLANLVASLKDQSSWLVVCWDGDQGVDLLPPVWVQPNEINDTAFEFEELREYRVSGRA